MNNSAEELHRNDEEQKEHKVDVIASTNTVTDPHAKMVKSEHAPAYLMTMLRRSRSSDHARVRDLDIGLTLIHSFEEFL